MVSGPLLFDTNVLIYALNGTRTHALDLLQARNDSAISLITWMEVLVGAPDHLEAATKQFLSGFLLIEITPSIAARAVEVRRQHSVKLPDAIIYASALETGRTLVTYNSRDFAAGTPGVHIPSA